MTWRLSESTLMPSLRIPLIALLLPVALCAEDQLSATEHHLRVSVHILPTAFDFQTESDGAGRLAEGPSEFDSFSRLRANYLAAIPFSPDAAFLIGGSVALAKIDTGGTNDLSQMGAGLEIGIAATPSKTFAVELVAQTGFGFTEDSAAKSGHYGEFGFAARPVLQLGMVELFFEGGWVFQRQKLDYGLQDTDIRTSGVQAGLGIGLIF